MKNHLISGGCGFVGRNMVKRLYKTTKDRILFIDNLSVGTDPKEWLDAPLKREIKGLKIYGEDERLLFIKSDFIHILRNLINDQDWFVKEFGIEIIKFADVFHFAAIVGGRAMIDGDPMKVALDLSIDAEFFYWLTRSKPERILYPSSSAAYPISKQTETNAIQLRESDIDFSNHGATGYDVWLDKTYRGVFGENSSLTLWIKNNLHTSLLRLWRRSGLHISNTCNCPQSCF